MAYVQVKDSHQKSRASCTLTADTITNNDSYSFSQSRRNRQHPLWRRNASSTFASYFFRCSSPHSSFLGSCLPQATAFREEEVSSACFAGAGRFGRRAQPCKRYGANSGANRGKHNFNRAIGLPRWESDGDSDHLYHLGTLPRRAQSSAHISLVFHHSYSFLSCQIPCDAVWELESIKRFRHCEWPTNCQRLLVESRWLTLCDGKCRVYGRWLHCHRQLSF